ncbi:hypothetical protein GGI35DRAFT_478077 [Trichoderma velutinum]
MAQQETITRLDIAELGLDEDQTPYSDGVACVRAYWAYALGLSQGERDAMRSLIVNHNYHHTMASREEFSEHPLLGLHWKNETGVDPLTSVVQDVFDMDTGRARRFQQRYPLLKVTPSTHRRRHQTVVPASPETSSSTMSVTLYSDSDESSPSPPAMPIPDTLSHRRTWNEAFGHNVPELYTALNNNQTGLSQTVAPQNLTGQQPFGSNERPMQNAVSLMQPPSATTTEATRPVTRQELDELRAEMAVMRAEMAVMRAERQAEMMRINETVARIKEDAAVVARNLYMLRREQGHLP